MISASLPSKCCFNCAMAKSIPHTDLLICGIDLVEVEDDYCCSRFKLIKQF